MNKEKLFEFLSDSPISHIAADNIVNILSAYGFKQVEDSDIESLCEGNYFIRRSGAVVAFKKNGASDGFMICATHTDSPAFRVKGESIVGSYGKLDAEKYGGMILSTWLDRPLGMAGRVGIRTDSGVKFKNLILDESVVIPNVAIHLNRSVNDGYKFNPAVDMLPLCSIGASRGELMQRVAEKLSVSVDDIVSHEIYLYAKDTPVSVGFSGELVLSPRLDDLACVHASLMAFLLCENKSSIPVFAAFDNEEIGSNTVQGADSLFFTDILRALSGSDREYRRMLINSLAVSADNAHAKHPNHPELSDSANAPTLGAGVVLKHNSNYRYATDTVSAGLFKVISDRCGMKLQDYYNRADIPGGSTVGAILSSHVCVPTVDIGLPQLAMHSACETMALSDYLDMIEILNEFYSSSLHKSGNEISIIK